MSSFSCCCHCCCFDKSCRLTNPDAGSTPGITLSAIGVADDKCWGFGGTTAWRGDVTGAIGATLNGVYTIAGVPVAPSGTDTDGVSLVVLYTDPAATYVGTFLVADGAVQRNGGVYTHTFTYPALTNPPLLVRAFSMISDLQVFTDSATQPQNLNGVNTVSEFYNHR